MCRALIQHGLEQAYGPDIQKRKQYVRLPEEKSQGQQRIDQESCIFLTNYANTDAPSLFFSSNGSFASYHSKNMLGAKHPGCVVSVISDTSSGHVDLFLISVAFIC